MQRLCEIGMERLQGRAVDCNGRAGAQVQHAGKLRGWRWCSGASAGNQAMHFVESRWRQRMKQGDMRGHMVALWRVMRATQALHLAKKRGGQPGGEDQGPCHPMHRPATREKSEQPERGASASGGKSVKLLREQYWVPAGNASLQIPACAADGKPLGHIGVVLRERV